MTARIYIGIDPGPIPGIAVLTVWGNGKTEAQALQCSHELTGTVIQGLLDAAHLPVTLAVERFVVGRSSMRSAHAGAITRDLVGQLQRLATVAGSVYVD